MSREVTVRESYIQPYMDLLLSKVIKCRTIEDLRECTASALRRTACCVTAAGCGISNPDQYSKFAYVSKDSMRRRIRLLEQELESLGVQRKPPMKRWSGECQRILTLEQLSLGLESTWVKQDIGSWNEKQREEKADPSETGATEGSRTWTNWSRRKAVVGLCDGKKGGMSC